MKDLRTRMARRHEEHIAAMYGLRRTRGSGNQGNDQTDCRETYRGTAQTFGLAVEGKSTLAASFSITRKIWDKLVEQAHWARPVLAVRLYDDEGLHRALDLAMLGENDLIELLEIAGCVDALRALLATVQDGGVHYVDRDGQTAVERLAADVARVLAGRQAVHADVPDASEAA